MRLSLSPAVLLSALLLVASAAHAAEVSGDITTTTWTAAESPYVVNNSITIPAGETLTIEPGVDVVLTKGWPSNTSISVQGALVAEGTETDSIRFIAAEDTCWGGIMLRGGPGEADTRLAYVRVSGVKAGISPVEVSTNGHEVVFDHCVISDNRMEARSVAYGAGLYAGYGSIITMTDCTIRNNVAVKSAEAEELSYARGGGIFSTCDLTLIDCVVQANSMCGSGGGIYHTGSSNPLNLVNCRIIENHADENGGGLLISGGERVIEGCIISRNTAGVSGGGIACENARSLLVRNCDIRDNHAVSMGGGITCESILEDTLRIEDCLIMDNSVDTTGGGIATLADTTIVTGTRIIGNAAVMDGGGFYADRNALTMDSCVVMRNVAKERGAGGFVYYAAIDMYRVIIALNSSGWVSSCEGTALFIDHGVVDMEQCTMSSQEIVVRSATLRGLNSTLRGNVDTYHNGSRSGSFTANYCNVSSLDFLYTLPGYYLIHCIDLDPVFGEGYALDPSSPGVDAGDPQSPLDPDGTPADMGCPATVSPLPILTTETQPASLTLSQNTPNPFNPSTTITFGVARSGLAKLAIYNTYGHLVRTLVDGEMPAGFHTVVWNGLDAQGRPAASGVYLYRLTSPEGMSARRMVLVR